MQQTYAANSALHTQIFHYPIQLNSPAHLQIRIKEERERCKDLNKAMSTFRKEQTTPLLKSSLDLWRRDYSKNLHTTQSFNTMLQIGMSLENLNSSLSSNTTTISNVNVLSSRDMAEFCKH